MTLNARFKYVISMEKNGKKLQRTSFSSTHLVIYLVIILTPKIKPLNRSSNQPFAIITQYGEYLCMDQKISINSVSTVCLKQENNKVQ